jgi:hypothetical protein
MFEGLEWRRAFKRATILIGLWLVSIYVFSTAFPGYFDLGLDSRNGIVAFVANAVFFFLFFAVLTAFTERSKKRRLTGVQKQRKNESGTKTTRESGASEDEEADLSDLKGRRNPNTSRKKSTRRRRR